MARRSEGVDQFGAGGVGKSDKIKAICVVKRGNIGIPEKIVKAGNRCEGQVHSADSEGGNTVYLRFDIAFEPCLSSSA